MRKKIFLISLHDKKRKKWFDITISSALCDIVPRLQPGAIFRSELF